MPTFLIGYHGQADMKQPASQEEGKAHMDNWMAWLGSLGDAVVNPGSPIGASKVVTSAGIAEDNLPNSMFGFTTVTADNIDAALSMAQSCPVIEQGGTLRVAELMEMPGA